MENTWIVLANETKAYIYSSSHQDGVQLVETLQHTRNPLHMQPISPQHQFARKIGRFLSIACDNYRYHDLVICAEPHFYTLIKKELTSCVWSSIRQHILQDYIPFNENKIQSVLRNLVKTQFKEVA